MIKVGDIILAYRKGIHRVIDVERRFATQADVDRFPNVYKYVGQEYSPLVTYEAILTSKFTKVKPGNIHCCDMEYCQKIDQDYIDKLAKQYEENLNRLRKLINEITIQN